MSWIIILYGLSGHPLPAADQLRPDMNTYTSEGQCNYDRILAMQMVHQWAEQYHKPVPFTARCEKREIRS